MHFLEAVYYLQPVYMLRCTVLPGCGILFRCSVFSGVFAAVSVVADGCAPAGVAAGDKVKNRVLKTKLP